jgi:crotonobetainyl-CoA:carnitine CoA-transferase CaiB-like acyl-CoA transferase
LWPDLATVERLVSAALELLFARQRTGKAGWREIAIEETARFLTLPLRFGLTARGALLGGGSPRYNLYRAKDGWIALAAIEPHFWSRLKSKLRLKTGSKRELQTAFRKRKVAEWVRWANSCDIPLAALRKRESRPRSLRRRVIPHATAGGVTPDALSRRRSKLGERRLR